MKISTRTRYGLKAVLVLASRYGEGSLAVSQIAKREGISVAYLEQILNTLKKKKFVKSVRGPQGGYILVKKPADTTLAELLEALDGAPGLPSGRQAPAGVPAGPESDEVKTADRLFWARYRQTIEKGLSEVTLKELIDEARRRVKGKGSPNFTFHI